MYVVCVCGGGRVIYLFIFLQRNQARDSFFSQLLSKSWAHKINFCVTWVRTWARQLMAGTCRTKFWDLLAGDRNARREFGLWVPLSSSPTGAPLLRSSVWLGLRPLCATLGPSGDSFKMGSLSFTIKMGSIYSTLLKEHVMTVLEDPRALFRAIAGKLLPLGQKNEIYPWLRWWYNILICSKS